MGIIGEELLDYFRDYQDKCRAVELLDDAVRNLGKVKFDRDTEAAKRVEEAKNTLKDVADRIRFENYDLWSNIIYRTSQLEGRSWREGRDWEKQRALPQEESRRPQDTNSKPD